MWYLRYLWYLHFFLRHLSPEAHQMPAEQLIQHVWVRPRCCRMEKQTCPRHQKVTPSEPSGSIIHSNPSRSHQDQDVKMSRCHGEAGEKSTGKSIEEGQASRNSVTQISTLSLHLQIQDLASIPKYVAIFHLLSTYLQVLTVFARCASLGTS